MHTSIVRLVLPEHRIEYTGTDARQARYASQKARGEGRSTSTEKKLVVGSSTLFHYTVISQEK